MEATDIQEITDNILSLEEEIRNVINNGIKEFLKNNLVNIDAIELEKMNDGSYEVKLKIQNPFE